MSESELPDLEFKINKNLSSIIFQRIDKDKSILKSSPKSSFKNWSDISEKQKKILFLIAENKDISKISIFKKIGINQSAVQKNLRKLREKIILKE